MKALKSLFDILKKVWKWIKKFWKYILLAVGLVIAFRYTKNKIREARLKTTLESLKQKKYEELEKLQSELAKLKKEAEEIEKTNKFNDYSDAIKYLDDVLSRIQNNSKK